MDASFPPFRPMVLSCSQLEFGLERSIRSRSSRLSARSRLFRYIMNSRRTRTTMATRVEITTAAISQLLEAKNVCLCTYLNKN